MIIINLKGGLGNQMFQYAIGRKLQLKYSVPLLLDQTTLLRRDFGPSFTYRNYELGMFRARPHVAQGHLHIDHIIREQSLLYSQNISNIFDFVPVAKNIFLDGYWQSDRYFMDIETQLREDFLFRDPLALRNEAKTLDAITSRQSVAVHVRRTDYLTAKVYADCGVLYIARAIDRLRTMVSNPSFFIFSDDMAWCKSHLNIKDAIFIDDALSLNKTDIHFQLMAHCKHFIIANSTFSWWAAWLGSSPDKIVIAPNQWFTNGMKTEIIRPDITWAKIIEQIPPN